MPPSLRSSALCLVVLAWTAVLPVVKASSGTQLTVSDVAELEAAFAQLPSLPPPVRIDVSAGEYVLTEALYANTSKVTLTGLGTVVFKPVVGMRTLFLDGVDDWLVEGISITGASFSAANISSQAGSVDVGGVVLLQNSDASFARVELTDTTDTSASDGVTGAIALLGGSHASFSDSTFTGNSMKGNGGVFYAQFTSVLSVDACEFTGNTAGEERGGAVYAEDTASLTTTGCTFSGNVADSGGAVHVSDDVQLTVKGCTFTGNKATSSSGGAVRAYNQARVTISASSFSGNEAGNDGGAIFVWNDVQLSVDGCRFDDNSAGDEGGALGAWNDAVLRINSSTFENNACTYARGACGGALVLWNDVVAELRDVTFTINTAPGNGGAIAVRNDVALSLEGCEFQENLAHIDGGALAMDDESTLVAASCVFSANVAYQRGGAMSLEGDRAGTGRGGQLVAELSRVSFTQNRAAVGGGALSTSENVSLAFTRCHFEDNAVVDASRRRQLRAEAAEAAEPTPSVGGGASDGARRRLQSTQGGGALLLGSPETWAKEASVFSGNTAFNGCDAIETQTDGLDAASGKTLPAQGVCTNAGADGGASLSGYHYPCGMCMRHRCSLWGANKCAARWDFTDPQGAEQDLCSCACCRQFCGRPKGCSVSHLELDEPPAHASSRARDDAVAGEMADTARAPTAARMKPVPAIGAALTLVVAIVVLLAWRHRSRRAAVQLV